MRGGSSVTPNGSPSGRSTSYSMSSPVGSFASSRKRSSAVRNSQSRKSSSARPLTAWSSVPGTSPNWAPSDSGATEWTRITAAIPTFKEFVRPDVATSTWAESSEQVNMKASRPRRQPAGGSHAAAERATGFEPATSSLGSWHSTPELRPRGAECVRPSRPVSTTPLRLLVPPRHDPLPRSLEGELLVRAGLERRHVHALGRYDCALRVQQLEAQLEGIVGLLANVRDHTPDSRALLVHRERAHRDLDRDQLALLQVVEGRVALVPKLVSAGELHEHGPVQRVEAVQRPRHGQRARAVSHDVVDRKSTRLNSS